MSAGGHPATDPMFERVAAAIGDNYAVEAELGRGGMSVVYRATDLRLKRRVAVKVLPPELAYQADVRSRFLREAEMAAGLSHSNIVPIYAVDERSSVVFFVMALVHGESLAQQLRREPHPAYDNVRRILLDVADALGYAHARGVVHRDVKPDNILIEEGSGRPLVTDFGIARAAETSRITATGVAVGTPAYMSPEQAVGEREIDGRSDLYSLGVVGYQMVAGEPPFRASNTPAMLMKQLGERPRPLRELRADVPQPLAEAIDVALRKRPDERWQTGAEFRAAILGAGAGARPVRASPTPMSEGQARDGRPRDIVPAITPLPLPLPGGGSRLSRRERAREERQRHATKPVAQRVRTLRASVVGYGSLVGGLGVINLLTSPGFPWFLFPALGMGMPLIGQIGSLWADGVPLRRMLRGPVPTGIELGIPEDDDALAADGLARDDAPSRGDQMSRPGATDANVRVGGPHDRGAAGLSAPSTAQSPRRNLPRGGLAPPPDAAGGSPGLVVDNPALPVVERFRRRFKLTAAAAALSVTSVAIGAPLEIEALIIPWVAGGFAAFVGAVDALFGMRRVRRAGVRVRDALSSRWRSAVARADRRTPDQVLRSEAAALAAPDVLGGPHGEAVRRVIGARRAITAAVERLGAADRELIPDVLPSADSVVRRAVAVATALHRLDVDMPPRSEGELERRIAEAKERSGSSSEQERTHALLVRQRESLRDLADRRNALLAQLESAELVLEGMNLDLLKLRSGGLQAALDDVTSVTQEARALSAEIGRVLDAADEVRRR